MTLPFRTWEYAALSEIAYPTNGCNQAHLVSRADYQMCGGL